MKVPLISMGPYRETTHLLRQTDYPSSESVQQILFFKKYLLLPLCTILPIAFIYLLLLNTGPDLPEDNFQLSASPNSHHGLPIKVPISINPNSDIPSIVNLLENGTRRIQRFHMTITKGQLYPDTTRQEVFLINGQYPGPVIKVKQNSILILTVTNRLDIPLTIHMHGLHQRGSYLSDGVPLVTQDPIPPGGSFTHTVNTEPQAGTFFYHAHTGMDIVWIAGPLIIEDDPVVYKSWPTEYQYDEERLFFLNGVYHQTIDDLVSELTGAVFRYPRVDSVTINGKGHGLDPPAPFRFPEEENDTTPIPPIKKDGPIELDITAIRPQRRYRFRFINSISDGTFSCKIPGHQFTVIEMDGIYSEPVETDSLVISPGQRYSLLVTSNKDVDNYFVACKHLEISGPTGLSVLKYSGAQLVRKADRGILATFLNSTTSEVVPNKQAELEWILDELTPNLALNQTDVYEVPDTVDQEFLIDVEEVKTEGQPNRYLINGHSYVDPKLSYYKQLRQRVNITDPPQVFEIHKGQVIQIIFQNQRLFSICFGHPWHLHGHSFHVVGHGPDRYDPVTDAEKIRENVMLRRKMQFRDTVTLNGEQTLPETERPKYCGWTAIRFIADNPGIWLAHCHVTPHMLMGKRFMLWEHSEEDPYLQDLEKSQASPY